MENLTQAIENLGIELARAKAEYFFLDKQYIKTNKKVFLDKRDEMSKKIDKIESAIENIVDVKMYSGT